jgi:hypothetical protein
MALNKDALKATLETLFQAAFDNNYEKAKMAEELAKVIDDYLKTADITGVVVQVRNPSNVVIGTGTQTNTVKLT